MSHAGLTSLPLADVITAFETSNFLSGQLIVIVLVVASIYAWTVMISKYRELKIAQSETRRFLASFRREGHPLTLFLRHQMYPQSPVYKVYESACLALGSEYSLQGTPPQDLLVSNLTDPSLKIDHYQVEVIRRVTERVVADQALMLEQRMGFLMTAVSCSPLLGLLGTVWGVLEAFGEVAIKGMANLATVAPGISGALLTTVVGLLVALPSTIGYNLLAGRIRELVVQMDNFSQEFVADLQRTLMSRERK